MEDEELEVYRIVFYTDRLYSVEDYYMDESVEYGNSIAKEEATFHLWEHQKSIGIGLHWTEDEEIAFNFRDYLSEESKEKVIAIIWEGRVYKENTLVFGDEELEAYGGKGVMPFWYEQEYFVKPGSTVNIDTAYVYPNISDDPEANYVIPIGMAVEA